MFESPFGRVDIIPDQVINLRNEILNTNYLLFFKGKKGFLVSLGESPVEELISLLNSTHVQNNLSINRFIISNLTLENLRVSRFDWDNLIPFLLDHSFRISIMRLNQEKIRFNCKKNRRRLFIINEYVKNDPQLGIIFLLGAEYGFVCCNNNNFSLFLDYSPYQVYEREKERPRYLDLELINPSLKHRLEKNFEILTLLFNKKALEMRLGDLCFILPPEFLKMKGSIKEIDV